MPSDAAKPPPIDPGVAADAAARSRAIRARLFMAWSLFLGAIGAQILLLIGLDSIFHVRIGDKLSQLTAQICTGVMRVLGDSEAEVRNGDIVWNSRFPVKIIFECSGLFNVVILVAAIVAFPAPILARIYGILGGTVVLLFVNQIRVLTLIWAGKLLAHEHFETFHGAVWQTLMIVFTVLIWYAWASMLRRPEAMSPQGARA